MKKKPKCFNLIHSDSVTMRIHAVDYISAVGKAMKLTGMEFEDFCYGGTCE